MRAVKDRWKLALPIILMIVLAISMWPEMSGPMARALGLNSGENFSAAYALAFCAGVYFPRRMRWTLPLGMFIIVNILTNHHYGVDLFHPYLLVKITAFCLVIWLGTRFSAKANWFKLVGGGLLSAVVFYIVTCTASWIWDPAYVKTVGGWLQALTIGSPGFPPSILFLFNSLISGGLFTGLFAGAMKLTAADRATEEELEPEPAGGAIVPSPEKSEA